MRSVRPWILWSDCLRVRRDALSWRMNLRFRMRSDPEVQCFAKNRWFDPGKPSLCQALITVDKLYFAFLTFNHHSWLPWNSIKLILENAKNRHAGEDGRGWLSGWVRRSFWYRSSNAPFNSFFIITVYVAKVTNIVNVGINMLLKWQSGKSKHGDKQHT